MIKKQIDSEEKARERGKRKRTLDERARERGKRKKTLDERERKIKIKIKEMS